MRTLSSPCAALLSGSLLLALGPALGSQDLVDTARLYVRPTTGVTPLRGEFLYLLDFDLDGDQDALWFRETPSTSVDRWDRYQLHENVGGELVPFGPEVAFPAGVDLRPITDRRLEDVNGDGWPDLVMVEAPGDASSALAVYPGTGPSGVFAAPLAIPAVGRDVVLGNVDADPERELGVVGGGQASWYDWDGATFVQSATSPAGGSPTGLLALDLEGDGDDDLVYGETGFQSQLWVHATAGGAPGPATSAALPAGSFSQLVPYAAELGGGAEPDLLVAARDASGYALIPILSQGGVLVPGTPQPVDSTTLPAFAAAAFDVGDWDGDGDVDAIYYPWQEPGGTTEAIVAFFENDGANAFAPAPTAKVETNYETLGANFGEGVPLGTVDLDRDGRLDWVGPAAVVLGRGRFESSLVSVTDPFFGASPLVLGDHEGDGDLDLYTSAATVLLNDGTGAFPASVLPPPPPPGRRRGEVAGIGDFTGDGRTDVLASIWIPMDFGFDEFEEIRLYADAGLDQLVDAGRASTDFMLPSLRGANLAHDVDGDGSLDLFGAGGYWHNDGHGRFSAFRPLFGSTDLPSAVGDLDGDGDLEVVTVSFTFHDVTVWKDRTLRHARRPGDSGVFFRERFVFQASSPVEPDSLTLTDLDLDGDLDLAFFEADDRIHLLENDGAGGFQPRAELDTNLSFGRDEAMMHLACDDLDGDGIVDVLCGSSDRFEFPRLVLAFRGLGAWQFEPLRAHAGRYMGPPGDLDGDGDLDLSGRAVVRSLRFDGPEDGRVRQYGAGTPGSGGAVPVLGASGPVRIGSTEATIRLRRGRGGAPCALFFSTAAGSGPALPFPGAPNLLSEPFSSMLFTAGGPAGAPGAGTLDVDLSPLLVGLAGRTFYFQAGLMDPAGVDGFALSNGLELTFGF